MNVSGIDANEEFSDHHFEGQMRVDHHFEGQMRVDHHFEGQTPVGIDANEEFSEVELMQRS